MNAIDDLHSDQPSFHFPGKKEYIRISSSFAFVDPFNAKKSCSRRIFNRASKNWFGKVFLGSTYFETNKTSIQRLTFFSKSSRLLIQWMNGVVFCAVKKREYLQNDERLNEDWPIHCPNEINWKGWVKVMWVALSDAILYGLNTKTGNLGRGRGGEVWRTIDPRRRSAENSPESHHRQGTNHGHHAVRSLFLDPKDNLSKRKPFQMKGRTHWNPFADVILKMLNISWPPQFHEWVLEHQIVDINCLGLS